MDNDLISREALKDVLKTELANVPQPDTDADYYIGVKQGLKLAETIIDNAPTVDMNTEVSVAYLKGRRQGQSDERSQGEWIFRSGGYYKCNKCGEVERAEKNFCPNCGAKMKAVQNEKGS